MTILELDRFVDEDGEYQEPHPERRWGFIPEELEPASHIKKHHGGIVEILRDVADGSKCDVEGQKYFVVHRRENGNFITSLETVKTLRRVNRDIKVLQNHAYSILECPDGIYRYEDHEFRDILAPGRPLQRIEYPDTVNVESESGLKLFWQFAQEINESLRQPA